MAVTHQIGDLVLDLTFRSSAGARRTVDDIQSWLEHELLPELDDVLTRYSPARETLRLGAIALDCGTLTRNNYKQAIRKRLFDELERIVPPQLLALNPEISFALNSGAAPDDNALHQLLGFLESGQLPWHRLQSDDELHGQLFDRIESHPQLARLLQPALRSAPALRRLVRQFSEARLNRILANLAPGLLPLAIALQDLFDLGELTRRIGRAARSAIHEAQWTGLLGMGFARESAVPDAAVLANLLRSWLAAADSWPDALAAALVPPVTSGGWADAGAAHRTLGEAVLRLAGDVRERVAVPGATESSRAALPAQAGATHAQRPSPGTPRDANEVGMLDARTSTSHDPSASPDVATANAKAESSPGAQTALEQTAFGTGVAQLTTTQTVADRSSAPVAAARAGASASGTTTDSTRARVTSLEQEAVADRRAPSAAEDARRPLRDAASRDVRAGETSPSAETTSARQEVFTPAGIERRLREALDAHDVRFLVLHWDTLRQALQHDRLASEIAERMRTADFRKHFIAHAPDFLLLDMLAPLQPAAAAALRALPGSTASALWRWLQAVTAQRATTPPPSPRRGRTRRDAPASETRTPAGTRDTASSAVQAPDASPMPAQFRQELWSALFSGSVIQPQEPWRLDTFVTRLLGAAAPQLLAEAATLRLRWLVALAADADGAANAEAQRVRMPVLGGEQQPEATARDSEPVHDDVQQQTRIDTSRDQDDSRATTHAGAAQHSPAMRAATAPRGRTATPGEAAQPGATSKQANNAIAALLPALPQGRSRRAQADALRKAQRARNDILQALLARSPADAAPTFTSAELAALVAELIEHDDRRPATQRPDVVVAVLERALRLQAPRRYLQHVLQLLLDGSEHDAVKLVEAAERAAGAAVVERPGRTSVESSPRDGSDSRPGATTHPAMQSVIDETTEAEAIALVVAHLRTQPAMLNAVTANADGWQRLLQQYLRTETAIGAGLAETIEGIVVARAHAAQEPQRIYRIALNNLLRGRRPLAGIAPSPAQPRDSATRPTSSSTPPTHTDAPQGPAGHSRAPIETGMPAHMQDAVTTQASTAADAPRPARVRATAAHVDEPAARPQSLASGTQRFAEVDAPGLTHEGTSAGDAQHSANAQARAPGAQQDVARVPTSDRAETADDSASGRGEAAGFSASGQSETTGVSAPDHAETTGTNHATPARAANAVYASAMEDEGTTPIQLDTLAANALPELCIALGTGSILPVRVHGTEGAWLALLAVYTAEVIGQDPSIRSDLLAAIRQHAQRAAQREHYYRNVLACLIAQVPLDLEELESADTPQALTQAPEYASTRASGVAETGMPLVAATETESSDAQASGAATARKAATGAAQAPADANDAMPSQDADADTVHSIAAESTQRDTKAEASPRAAATEAVRRDTTADATQRETATVAAKREPVAGTTAREATTEAAGYKPASDTALHETTAEAAKRTPASGTAPREQHKPRKRSARASDATGIASTRASQPEALPAPPYDTERERNPWLVTATLLARDTLSNDEQDELTHVLAAVLAETQPVRLRGWLKLLGDTRLHRGWTAHVARAQLVRLIRHAVAALPDAPQDRLQALESTDAPLGVATELYAAFNATRRQSAVVQARSAAESTEPHAAAAAATPLSRAAEDKSSTQARNENPARGAQHAAEDEREQHGKRDTGSKRDPEGNRETNITRAAPHPNTDINAIEALHEAALDLARALAEPNVPGAAQVQLKRITDAILNQRDATLLREWRKVFTGARLQQGLVRHLPAHVLERLLRQLAPDVWPMLDASSSLVVQALGLLVADARSHAIEQAKWQFLFERAFTAGARADADLLAELAQVLAIAAGLDDSTRLLQLIERRRLALSTRARQAQASSAQSADVLTFPGYDQDDTAPDAGLARDVHLDNAGIVLVAPFIPRLFSMLNVTVNGNFPDHAAAERGVHLLQFLVTGQEFTPEYRLLLNKVMCGVIPNFPVCAGIDVSPQEKDAIEQLLQSIIQHWKILGGTSIAGLRQTFLQREGWLRQDENGWHVEVKPGSFDMLLDQLPWSYSLIKFTWMDKPMHVTWRNKQTQ